MPLSTYLEKKLLDLVFSATAFTAPATVFLGLSTQTVAGATDANILTGEPTATGSYGRVSITNNATNFPAAGGSQPSTKFLAVSFSFTASTAAWSTGANNLNTFFLNDASTLAGGNVLCWAALNTPTAVNASGITITFNANALEVLLT